MMSELTLQDILTAAPQFAVIETDHWEPTLYGVNDGKAVSVAALYKKLNFRLIGPVGGRPVIFDDTVYFISFATEAAARRALVLLTSPPVQAFLRSMIFWDDMRPIKTEILNRLDLSGIELREAA